MRYAIAVLAAGVSTGCDDRVIGGGVEEGTLAAREVDCAAREADRKVDIAEYRFDPMSISVAAGQVVQWTNVGEVEHTVTSGSPGAPNEGEAFDSGDLEPGDRYCLELTEIGSFEYFCEYHRSMRGAVVVELETPGGEGRQPEKW